MLIQRDSHQSGFSKKSIFESLQLDSTRDRYVGWAVRFSTFILRHVLDPSSRELPLNITTDQTRLALAFNACLEGSLSDPDDVEKARVAAGDFLDALYFTQHESVAEQANKDPHAVFLALAHLDPNTGNFSKPSVIAHNMSGFLYGFRPLAIRHIHLSNAALGLPNHNNLYFE